jgi:hypothetical protein
VPKIIFFDENGEKHHHYVDIFIPSKNKMIEIKSAWTVQKKHIFFKQTAGKALGYEYEIWIYDPKGDRTKVHY